MVKRPVARGNSTTRVALSYAPQRLEETIHALTAESIEESLSEIEIAFQQHFDLKARDRLKNSVEHEGVHAQEAD